MPAPPLLIVGSSGFIGRAMVRALERRGQEAVGVSRQPCLSGQAVRTYQVTAYDDASQLQRAAGGCASAILLAGRAHITGPERGDSLQRLMQANCELPVQVAKAFAATGGRRIVLVSSIAVNGASTRDAPFSSSSMPAPVTDYGRSKLAGEEALQSLCRTLGLELVIVRPPLVYGSGAPGNFGQLIRAARRGWPLPLASLRNRRDFIGVDNLVDLLLHASVHENAAGKTFLVTDCQRTSTADFAHLLYTASGHPRRLLPFPPAVLKAAAALTGRAQMFERLANNLEIDGTAACTMLNWLPPVTLEEGVRRSIEGSVK
ncbi:MAG TPA: NAD-dependent epimerase/dehydratase family protein [Sphingomicrobium sp.]|nr:NAD-dependent epimerase/dehydratase family protein [Sphingomicrobium sp.]